MSRDIAGASAPALPRTRRSKALVDRFWDLFASVRLAIVLIFAIALAAIVGTLIQQEPFIPSLSPERYYSDLYGPFWGTLFFNAGLTRVYSSWWFVGLLVLIGLNLIVCSLHRIGPLWRSMQQPQLPKTLKFLRTQRVREEVPGQPPEGCLIVRDWLVQRGYRTEMDETTVFGEKGRFSRWGPYVVHIGLLIMLAAGLMRIVPGWYMDDYVKIREGETVLVPGADFAVRNEAFRAEYYPDGRPSHFSTEAVVIEGGRETVRHLILVNDPLVYKGIRLHQASFQVQIGSVSLALFDRRTGELLGDFEMDLSDLQPAYAAGSRQVAVLDYFPDFGFGADGQPVSLSRQPNNPAFTLQVIEPDGTRGPAQLYLLAYPLDTIQAGQARYGFLLTGAEDERATVLMVKKDRGIPVFFTGTVIMVLGVFQSFYSYHRRIWAQRDGDTLVLAAKAHKNETALRWEVSQLKSALLAPAGARGERSSAHAADAAH